MLVLCPEFEHHLTTKNWALVFLKCVSEGSAAMRGELEKHGIDIKVGSANILSTIS
jgi:hypothetical protein